MKQVNQQYQAINQFISGNLDEQLDHDQFDAGFTDGCREIESILDMHKDDPNRAVNKIKNIINQIGTIDNGDMYDMGMAYAYQLIDNQCLKAGESNHDE